MSIYVDPGGRSSRPPTSFFDRIMEQYAQCFETRAPVLMDFAILQMDCAGVQKTHISGCMMRAVAKDKITDIKIFGVFFERCISIVKSWFLPKIRIGAILARRQAPEPTEDNSWI